MEVPFGQWTFSKECLLIKKEKRREKKKKKKKEEEEEEKQHSSFFFFFCIEERIFPTLRFLNAACSSAVSPASVQWRTAGCSWTSLPAHSKHRLSAYSPQSHLCHTWLRHSPDKWQTRVYFPFVQKSTHTHARARTHARTRVVGSNLFILVLKMLL